MAQPRPTDFTNLRFTDSADQMDLFHRPEPTENPRPREGTVVARTQAVYPEPLVLDDASATTSGADVRKYWTIAKHPTVKSALDWRIAGAFEEEWSIVGVNDYDRYPEYEQWDAKFRQVIEDQIAGMSDIGGTEPTFDDMLKNILANGIIGGYVIAEKELDRYATGVQAGQWYLRTVTPHYSFNFDIDVYTDQSLAGIDWIPGGKWITGEWLAKFVVAPYPSLQNRNYYGESELQSIYRDVKVLELLEEAAVRGVRYLAVKPIIHWYEGNNLSTETVTAIRNAIFNLESGGVVSLAFETGQTDKGAVEIYKNKVEMLDDRASPDGIKSIEWLVDLFQKRINRTLGRPDHLGYTDTTTGSHAQARTQYRVGQAEHVQDREFVESVVNQQIIPDMIRYNYPNLPESYRYPQFRFARRRDMELMLRFLEAGVVDRAQVADEAGLPAPPITPDSVAALSGNGQNQIAATDPDADEFYQ